MNEGKLTNKEQKTIIKFLENLFEYNHQSTIRYNSKSEIFNVLISLYKYYDILSLKEKNS